MKRSIKSEQRSVRMLAFSIDMGNSDALDGPDALKVTASASATPGQVTCTIDTAFSQQPVVVATCEEASHYIAITTLDTDSFVIECRTDAGVLADKKVGVVIIGSDVSDNY